MKKSFVDQLQRTIEIEWPPKRIVSLVPSQTELLFDLGLSDEVVGITKFCVHPRIWHKNKKRVGGTKTLNLEAIIDLKPDLIIANKEENGKLQIGKLSKKFPVWISNIVTLSDARDMIESIGELVDKETIAQSISLSIENKFQFALPLKTTRVAYLIWNEPMMTINADTFINAMLLNCGFENVFASKIESRYPEITEDELQKEQPELVLLSSEPFPFKKKHIAPFQTMLPNSKVMLVDGEMFSWYGSRLKKAPAHFQKIIDLFLK